MENSQKSGGIGFFGLLTILFIGLKLTGYINWSWVWVLSPLWIPTAILLSFFLLVLTLATVSGRGVVVNLKKSQRK